MLLTIKLIILSQILLRIFFKVDKSMLYCGISAYVPAKTLTAMQKRVVYSKIKIVGLYNEKRGEQGCGMLLNGQIYKGWDDWKGAAKKDTKLFRNFIAEHSHLEYENGPIIIHSRQPTVGSGYISAPENNHPFVIPAIDGNPDKVMTLVHNGSITNMWDLCKKYDLDFNAWTVDSHGLGMLMQKIGLSILNEYEGYAALIWTFSGEPDTLYAYHGKYCEHKDDEEKDCLEERPMFFLETPEGIYFSSMDNALDVIKDAGQKVIKLNYNTVFQFKQGKVTKFRHAVDRMYGPNTKKARTYTHFHHGRPWNNVAYGYHEDDDNDTNSSIGHTFRSTSNVFEFNGENKPEYGYDTKTTINVYGGYINGNWTLHTDNPKHPIYGKNKPSTNKNTQLSLINNLDSSARAPLESKILHETLPIQARGNSEGGTYQRVYFWRGRYHLPGALLCNGILYLTDKGVMGAESSPATKSYYFFKGIMLKSRSSFDSVKELIADTKSIINEPTFNFALSLSKYSLYPVTNYIGESDKVSSDYHKFAFFEEQKRYHKNDFTVKFSSRRYYINRDGFLEKITSSEKKDKEFFLPYDFTPKKSTAVLSKENEGKSPYDMVFETEIQCSEYILDVHFNAMKSFCRDYMRTAAKKNSSLDPDTTEVENEVYGVIRAAVAKGKSIREEIEDASTILEAYEDYNETIISNQKKEDEEIISDIHDVIIGTPDGSSKDIEIISDEEQENIIEEVDKAFVREQIRDKMDNIIISLGDVCNQVDEISGFIEDEYAQSLTEAFARVFDNMKHKLAEVAEEYKDEITVKQINKTLNSVIV